MYTIGDMEGGEKLHRTERFDRSERGVQ